MLLEVGIYKCVTVNTSLASTSFLLFLVGRQDKYAAIDMTIDIKMYNYSNPL